jgi:hypothetical protein
MIAVEASTSPDETAAQDKSAIIQHYSSLYNLEDLMAELATHEIDLSIFDGMDLEKIFRVAVQNGLADLVEYIYVWHGVEYSLDELFSDHGEKFRSDMAESSVPALYDAGASSELNLQFWNSDDQKRNRSAKTLISLRKYSEMRCREKKFYYRFKPKYRYKFQK